MPSVSAVSTAGASSLKSPASIYGIANFLLAFLLFISADAVGASFGSVWSTGTTDTSITIDWTSLPYGKYKWSGSCPKYKICYKKAGAWHGACSGNGSSHVIYTNAKPYTITGMLSTELYKIKVYAHTLKKNLQGKWKNPKWRKVGPLTQSTQAYTPHTGTVAIVGATSHSLDVEVTYTHPSDFEFIRICYKKTWLPISLNAKCSQSDIASVWNSSNKNRGWFQVSSVSNLQVTLHPWTPLSRCRRYKVVAYGFPSCSNFGTKIDNHAIGRTNGWCWWWLKKGMIAEISSDHPEVLSAYVDKVNAFDKDTSLFSQLADQYPVQYPVLSQAEQGLVTVTEGGEDSGFNNTHTLVEYLIAEQPDILRAWQEEEELKEAQLDLETFIENEFPEVVELLPQEEFEIANAYVTAVDVFYKGEYGWFNHLAEQHPDLLEAKQMVEDSGYDLSDPPVLFDYLNGERQDIWEVWQKEESLNEAGLYFEDFVEENYPEYWANLSFGLEVKPNMRNFGDVTVSSSAAQPFTISNRGDIPLHIGTIEAVDSTTDNFIISDDDCSGKKLSASAKCQFLTEFQPQSEGEKTATLTVPYDDEFGTPGTPLDVPLIGTGVDWCPNPIIKVRPDPINFGSVPSGDSTSLPVSVRMKAKNCKLQLEIDDITVIGPDADKFSK
jgi:hypothetical protein